MAKQLGILPISGAVGNVQFFKGRDGSFRVRQKSTVDNNRVATDPAYKRTREHMAEFTAAAKGSKLLRDAVNVLVAKISDKYMPNRLLGTMLKVVKADTVNDRGKRNITDGDLQNLKKFEFSITGPVSNTFVTRYVSSIDRVSGKMKLSIPESVTEKVVFGPREATHFQIHLAALEIDFLNEKSSFSIASTEIMSLEAATIPAKELEASIPAASPHPLILFLAVEFWLETNGKFYPANSKNYNGAMVLDISQN